MPILRVQWSLGGVPSPSSNLYKKATNGFMRAFDSSPWVQALLLHKPQNNYVGMVRKTFAQTLRHTRCIAIV